MLFQTDEERCSTFAKGGVPIGVGKNSHLRRAIIDKNARIGDNVKVMVNPLSLQGLVLPFMTFSCNFLKWHIGTDILVQIINANNVQEAAREADGYFIKAGIVVIIKGATIPSGTII